MPDAATKQHAPSWLWDLTDDKRRALLAKRGRSGQPLWTIEALAPEEVLRRLFTPIVEVAIAKVAPLPQRRDRKGLGEGEDLGLVRLTKVRADRKPFDLKNAQAFDMHAGAHAVLREDRIEEGRNRVRAGLADLVRNERESSEGARCRGREPREERD
jgi:hypothetical protein